jgi:hypothetical protein
MRGPFYYGRVPMKNNIAMRIRCEECKVKYDIPNDETFWNYNIYFVMGKNEKCGISMPHLLCPRCTEQTRI